MRVFHLTVFKAAWLLIGLGSFVRFPWMWRIKYFGKNYSNKWTKDWLNLVAKESSYTFFSLFDDVCNFILLKRDVRSLTDTARKDERGAMSSVCQFVCLSGCLSHTVPRNGSQNSYHKTIDGNSLLWCDCKLSRSIDTIIKPIVVFLNQHGSYCEYSFLATAKLCCIVFIAWIKEVQLCLRIHSASTKF